MHWSPAVQQLAAVVQLSYSFEHPCGLVTHTSVLLDVPLPDERQKPVQHWSPEEHELPVCSHGGSTQKPRRLSAVSSCPSR
jgi:hypothetical protein